MCICTYKNKKVSLPSSVKDWEPLLVEADRLLLPGSVLEGGGTGGGEPLLVETDRALLPGVVLEAARVEADRALLPGVLDSRHPVNCRQTR